MSTPLEFLELEERPGRTRSGRKPTLFLGDNVELIFDGFVWKAKIIGTDVESEGFSINSALAGLCTDDTGGRAFNALARKAINQVILLERTRTNRYKFVLASDPNYFAEGDSPEEAMRRFICGPGGSRVQQMIAEWLVVRLMPDKNP